MYDSPTTEPKDRFMKRAHLIFALAVFCVACVYAAEPPPATMPVGPDGVRRSMMPAHAPLAPEARGKPYKVPATHWETSPVLWGWACELPDGSGLQFGGVSQLSEDGRGHTLLKVDGQWKPLEDELRKANPLQKQYEKVRALREGCKDALAAARSLYFDGLEADAEVGRVKAEIDPALGVVASRLADVIAELRSPGDRDAYGALVVKSGVKSALAHLDAAAALVKPMGGRIDSQLLTALRNGQVELELGGEFLDAEPPARALSLIAWDAKTKVYVLFGGDHTDYFTNDLWTFDPSGRRWMRRQPVGSPEPRADHQLDASGDGRVVMYGGYTRTQAYTHVGPARWIYDLEKNAWTADGHDEKLVATGLRSADYGPPGFPEKFMKGPRPDAAANEAKLAAIPVNTWVRLDTPIPLGGRDWGTWVFDPDRDLWYVYAGGHASYSGNDVARYHLSTGRWEITDPTELPLGGAGSNEQYPAGLNFNGRPWCRNHVWNSQAYEPTLKRLINVGVTMPKIDPYFYVYDPAKADWIGRYAIAKGMNNSTYAMQARGTPHGVFAWANSGAWLLDPATLQWKRLDVTGKMPETGVDSCGMTYDAKRDRMLLLTLGGYAKPYDGQIHALDFKTLHVAPLNPQGMNSSKSWRILLREAAFDPAADLMVLPQLLDRERKPLPDQILAYDAANNRWVVIETAGVAGRPFSAESVSTSIAYDAKRKLFWCGDSSWDGAIRVLRLDLARAKIAAVMPE